MELFRTNEILVRTNDVASKGDVCFIVFQPWNSPPSLSNPGFGEIFFNNLKVSAIFITPSINNWYQTEESLQGIRIAGEFAAGFSRRITYGSSMGGFAAINFANVVNASLYLALMPQFSIDRQKVPFESRWSAEAAKIDFNYDRIGSFERGPVGFVIYDPFDWKERKHSELIEQATGCHRIPLPFIGHNGPAGEVNKMLITQAIARDFEGTSLAVRQVHRSTRRTNAPYYIELSRHSRFKDIDLRRRILTLGLAKTYGHASIQAELEKLFPTRQGVEISPSNSN